MSQQGSMVIKKGGHSCVYAMRYKVCRIENVRDDGPILLCLDRILPGIGYQFWEPYLERGQLIQRHQDAYNH